MLLRQIVTLAILIGQTIKLPFFSGGVSLLDLLIIATTIHGVFKLKFKLAKPPLFIKAALIFILTCIISLILTPLNLMPEEYLSSFSYTARFTIYILFAWVIISKAFPNFQKNIFPTLIHSGFGLAIVGLLQFLILPDLSFLTKDGWDPHYFRTVSTFLDPNFSGAFFTLTLILLLSLPTLKSSKKYKIFFTVIFIALLTTFSRSSYLMFLVSGVSLAFFKKSKNLVGLTILLFSILLLGFGVYTQLVSEPRNIDRGKSASFRLNSWQQGGQLFQSHPILGVGFNAYRYALKQFNLGDHQFLSTHGASSNDSSLLFVASATGVLGLLAYLFFLISLILKTKNYLLSASLIGLVVHSIFANSLFYPPILLMILLISINPKE